MWAGGARMGSPAERADVEETATRHVTAALIIVVA